jgi:hypothetical protein
MVAKYLGEAMVRPIRSPISRGPPRTNERDHEAFLGAIEPGRLPVLEGL